MQKKTGRHVQWDEDKLRQTQQLRSVPQINEPKTPYRCNSDSDDEHTSPQQKTQVEIALDASLEAARQQSRVDYQKSLNLAKLNARLTMQIGTNEEFKKKSEQHYKEFKNMQTAKQHQRECEPQASK